MPKTSSFELDFKAPKKGKGWPFTPNAQIFLKMFTQDADDGPPIVTARCASFGEFDSAVDSLMEELKGLRKRAKRKFEEHDEEWAKTKEEDSKENG